jgi:riboflavin synthase alpha subunit
MFTGIIEAIGTVADLRMKGTNREFKIESPISHELKNRSKCIAQWRLLNSCAHTGWISLGGSDSGNIAKI